MESKSSRVSPGEAGNVIYPLSGHKYFSSREKHCFNGVLLFNAGSLRGTGQPPDALTA